MRDAHGDHAACTRGELDGMTVEHKDGRAFEDVEQLLERMNVGIEGAPLGQDAEAERGVDRADRPVDQRRSRHAGAMPGVFRDRSDIRRPYQMMQDLPLPRFGYR